MSSSSKPFGADIPSSTSAGSVVRQTDKRGDKRGDKHPADVLADRLSMADVDPHSHDVRDQAEAMLRTIPALETERDNVRSINARISEEMGQLRAELAALKAQAPAAWAVVGPTGAFHSAHSSREGAERRRAKRLGQQSARGYTKARSVVVPLYTAPQAAKPLTAAQRFDAYSMAEKVMMLNGSKSWRDAIADEIERAHGIGKEGGAA